MLKSIFSLSIDGKFECVILEFASYVSFFSKKNFKKINSFNDQSIYRHFLINLLFLIGRSLSSGWNVVKTMKLINDTIHQKN